LKDCTLVSLQMIFSTHTEEKKKWYYTLTSLQLVLFIPIGEEKQWYCTLESLQVVFSTHVRGKNKWYCTLVGLQKNIFVHIGKCAPSPNITWWSNILIVWMNERIHFQKHFKMTLWLNVRSWKNVFILFTFYTWTLNFNVRFWA
jgi:hypothetical protein